MEYVRTHNIKMRNRDVKNRKVTIIVNDDMYTKFQKIAYVTEFTPNHLIGKIMSEYVNKNIEYVTEYDKLY